MTRSGDDKKIDDQSQHVIEDKDHNFVIVDIPSGKKYIGAEKAEMQNSQKGDTCWYYARNMIRPRLGKKLEEELIELKNKNSSGEKQDLDVEALLQKRKSEKIISEYRKKITLLTQQKEDWIKLHREIITNFEINNIKINKITKETAGVSIRILTDMYNKSKDKELDINIKILKKFVKSRQMLFSDFIAHEYSEVTGEACLSTIKKLGKEDELEKRSQFLFGCSSKDLPKKEQHNVYKNVLESIASTLYGFKVSGFDPKDSFDEFFNALKTEGALLVSGMLGAPYYNNDPIKEPINTLPSNLNYTVYFWKKGSAKPQDPDINLHQVVVVGAQRMLTSAGKMQETVLFLDPKDESKPDQPRNLYRMSFAAFRNNVANVYSQLELNRSEGDAKVDGPFAYCPDSKIQHELYSSSEKIKNRR